MTEEQIRDALRHLFQSEEILRMAIAMSLDEYRAIEAGVRKESADKIAELERQLAEAQKDAELQANKHFGDLLATIHRDGGHHLAEHGPNNSCKVAIALWCDLQKDSEALAAIRALEPVAWRFPKAGINNGFNYVESMHGEEARFLSCWEPLYTAPPKAQPMSDVQIAAAHRAWFDGHLKTEVIFHRGVRAAERHHNITGDKG